MTDPINSVDMFRVASATELTQSGGSHGTPRVSSAPSSLKSAGVEASEVIADSRLVDAVQGRINESGSRVNVGVETVNGTAVFIIKDADTGRVIRRIPNDEAQRIGSNIDRLSGIFLDRIE